MTIEDLIQGMNEHNVQCYPRKIKEGQTEPKGITASFANPASASGRSFIDRAPIASNDNGQGQWGWKLGRDCQGQAQQQASAAPAQSSAIPA